MDYDVGTVKQRRIISPSSLYFVTPATGAPALPSYNFLGMNQSPGGGGDTVALGVTVSAGANLLVVAGEGYNGTTITSVTANGFAMTPDVTITASSSGASIGVYSIPTATCGTGSVTIVLTIGANFLFRSIYIWECLNLASTTVKHIVSNDANSTPPNANTIAVNNHDLLFAVGNVQASEVPSFSGSSVTPTAEHSNSTAEDSADWLIAADNAAFSVSMSWSVSSHNSIIAAASYA